MRIDLEAIQAGKRVPSPQFQAETLDAIEAFGRKGWPPGDASGLARAARPLLHRRLLR